MVIFYEKWKKYNEIQSTKNKMDLNIRKMTNQPPSPVERELASRADQRVLRWFGHAEKMDKYRMARRVLMTEVSGGRVRGRPWLGCMDGLKVALGNRGMTVEAARQCAEDRKEWRALVHTYVIIIILIRLST